MRSVKFLQDEKLWRVCITRIVNFLQDEQLWCVCVPRNSLFLQDEDLWCVYIHEKWYDFAGWVMMCHHHKEWKVSAGYAMTCLNHEKWRVSAGYAMTCLNHEKRSVSAVWGDMEIPLCGTVSVCVFGVTVCLLAIWLGVCRLPSNQDNSFDWFTTLYELVTFFWCRYVNGTLFRMGN
jgi:hypothetical protein